MPDCVKTKYATEQFALDDIARIKKSSTRAKIPTKAYLCEKCSFWHLTSKDDIVHKQVLELLQELTKLRKENEKLKNKHKEIQEVNVSLQRDKLIKQLKTQLSKCEGQLKRAREESRQLITKKLLVEQELAKYKTLNNEPS